MLGTHTVIQCPNTLCECVCAYEPCVVQSVGETGCRALRPAKRRRGEEGSAIADANHKNPNTGIYCMCSTIISFSID